MPLTASQQAALVKLAEASVTAAVEVLATLVQRRVEVGPPDLTATAWEAGAAGSDQPMLVVQVEYVSGVQGFNWLVLEVEGARAIAASMMGEALGDDVELDELHVSALAEAMNQMMGASATVLSSLLERPIAISPPTIQLQAAGAPPPAPVRVDPETAGQALAVLILSFPLRMQDDAGTTITSRVLQVFPDAFARRLADDYLSRTAPSRAGRQPAPPKPAPFAREERPGSARGEPDGAGRALAPEIWKRLAVPVSVRLGSTFLPLEHVYRLVRGSVVPLEVREGEPVDVLVSGTLIARGEVVVIREHFGVRITEIVRPGPGAGPGGREEG